MKFNFNLLPYKTRSFVKNNKAVRKSLSYSQATSIGILFSVEDKIKHENIKELIKKLEKDGKQVNVLTFLPKGNFSFEFMFDFFTSKEVTFWGNITADCVSRFVETPFDFLFYLDVAPNPLTLNVIAQSRAKCRVGKLWPKGERFFELMIETAGDTKALIDSVYKYVTQLR